MNILKGKVMKKAVWMMMVALLMVSCSSDTQEGNAAYLTGDMIVLEMESGLKMFFLDNKDGTVSVTYDRSDPMHTSGTTSQNYKGIITIPGQISFEGNSKIVTGITESAFMNCGQLQKVIIPATVKSIGKMAFYNCSLLEEVNIPDAVTELPDYCFFGCKALQQINLSNQLEQIGISCFSGCSSMAQIEFPNSITKMKSFAFQSCSKLKQVTLPNNMTALDDSVFFNCSGLVTAFLPKSMTTLGEGAFAGCRSMVELTLPESLVNIGAKCFWSLNDAGESNWKNFTLNVQATVPPVLKASISNAYERRRIVVPRGYRDAYLAADYWNEFTQVMERNY